MFEKFTNRARQVVVRAQVEGRALHHGYIGTEHLLLALVHERQGMGAMVLDAMGAGEDRVRDRVGHYIQPGDHEPGSSGHIPFTPRAKTVLELSLREAIQLGHDTIGTEHLLLALIREQDGIAGQALADLGVRLSPARQEVVRFWARPRRHDIDPDQDPGEEPGSKPAP
jgi:ATP-dependent Clp protease ATP-binding subunit ClpC